MAKTKLPKPRKLVANNNLSGNHSIEELKKSLENGLYIHSSPPKVVPNGSGLHRIRDFIRAGDIGALEELLLSGHGQALINQPSTDKTVRAFLKTVPAYMTKIELVHDAAERGSLRDLKALLDRRKLSRSKDSQGIGLLHKAVLNGHKEIVDYIISEYPESVDVTDHRNGELRITRPTDEVKLETKQRIGETTSKIKLEENIPRPSSKSNLSEIFTANKPGKNNPTDKSFLKRISCKKSAKKKKKHPKSSKDYYLYKTVIGTEGHSWVVDLSSVSSQSGKGEERGTLQKSIRKPMSSAESSKCWNSTSSAKPEAPPAESIHGELLHGVEMELAEWETHTDDLPDSRITRCRCFEQPTKRPNSCSSKAVPSNRRPSEVATNSQKYEGENGNEKGIGGIKRTKFPRILSSNSTKSEALSLAPSRQGSIDIRLTHHPINPSPRLSEHRSTPTQIVKRREKSIQTHLKRMCDKSNNTSSPLTNSMNSFFTKLPPLPKHSVKDFYSKVERPSTPRFIRYPSTESIYPESFLTRRKNSLPRLSESAEVRECLLNMNQNINRRNSQSESDKIVEENEREHKEISSLDKVKFKTKDESTKLFSFIHKCETIVKINKSGLTLGTSEEAAKDKRNPKQLSLYNYSIAPKFLQTYVDKLVRSILILVSNDIIRISQRYIDRKSQEKKIYQMILDHDVTFWGSILVDKIIEENFDHTRKKENFGRLSDQNFVDLDSLESSLGAEVTKPWSDTDGRSPRTDSLMRYALSKISSNDHSTRFNSGANCMNLLI